MPPPRSRFASTSRQYSSVKRNEIPSSSNTSHRRSQSSHAATSSHTSQSSNLSSNSDAHKPKRKRRPKKKKLQVSFLSTLSWSSVSYFCWKSYWYICINLSNSITKESAFYKLIIYYSFCCFRREQGLSRHVWENEEARNTVHQFQKLHSLLRPV